MKVEIPLDLHRSPPSENVVGGNILLEARALSKRYAPDAPLALENLDLQVSAGQIYCLLGANGAGKTTCLNLFLGFIRPTSGAALVDGGNVQEDPLRAKAQLGYVPENVALYGEFTALENLEYFASLGGRPVSIEEQRRVLAEIGLPEASIRRSVKTFSKGMRQKLGIAIAMVKRAPAVLLDEPTTGLDPESGREFVHLLKLLRDEGKAILMSTHDIFRVRGLADRVGIMNRGRLVADLAAAELGNQDLEQLYLRTIDSRGIS